MKSGALTNRSKFLSSNAQDFIEDRLNPLRSAMLVIFLSSNAQDFIEEAIIERIEYDGITIPEQ